MPKKSEQVLSENCAEQNRRSRRHDFTPRSRFGLGILTLVTALALAVPVAAAKKKGGGGQGGPGGFEIIPLEIEFSRRAGDDVLGDLDAFSGDIYTNGVDTLEAIMPATRNFRLNLGYYKSNLLGGRNETERVINLSFPGATSPFPDYPCNFSNLEPAIDENFFASAFVATTWLDKEECLEPGLGLLCLAPGEEAHTQIGFLWRSDDRGYGAVYQAETAAGVDLRIDVTRCSDADPDACARWSGGNPNSGSWDSTWIFSPQVVEETGELATAAVTESTGPKVRGQTDWAFHGACGLDFQIRVSCINAEDCPCLNPDGTACGP